MELKLIGHYNYDSKRDANSTDNIEFEGPKLSKNQIAYISHASIVNYTTKNKVLIIGKRTQSDGDRYIKVRQGSALNSCWSDGVWILDPDESALAICESPTDGDVVYCSFNGRLYEINP